MSVSHDHGYLPSGAAQVASVGSRAVPTPQQPSAPPRQMLITNRQAQYVTTQSGSYAPPVVAYSHSQQGYQQQTTHQMYQQHSQGNGAQMINGVVYMQQNTMHTTTSSHLSLNLPMREPTPEPVIVKEEIPDVKPSIEDLNQEEEDDADIDIQIRNVVCNYTLPLHIDLRRVALNCNNVTFDRGRGVLMKQKRNPNCYVKVYSSGKVYIVGCRSEADCRVAARSVARTIQRTMDKVHVPVSIRNYKVCNVLATCKMPFGIKIEELSKKHPANSQYEPELSVGLVWRSKDPKATLRIHTTGSITITGATSENDVIRSIELIYPIVREFRCAQRSRGEGKQKTRKRQAPKQSSSAPPAKRSYGGDERQSGAMGNRMYFSDEEEDIYDEDDLLDDDEV